MKRKVVALLLCVAMAAALFTACAQKAADQPADKPSEQAAETSAEKPAEQPAEVPVIKFWTFHTNYEGQFMNDLTTEYKKVNPKVEVKYESIPQGDYMGTKLVTAFAANSGPDVFVMSPGDFLKYANTVALDLTPYYTDAIKDDFLESSIQAVTVNNKICGIPFEIELLGLYYNKKLLEDAGVTPPKTWDELKAATKTLTKGKVAGLLIEPNKGYYQNFTWYPFMWQKGVEALDVANKKGTFEGQGVEEAMQLWGDLVKAGAPSKISVSGTWDLSLVAKGEAAMQVCGTWAIGVLDKDYPDAQVGLVPLPVPADGKAATDAGGWKMMVSNKGKYADEAAKFAMWAFAEDIKMPLKWCTDVKFAYSPRKSVMEAGKDIYSKGLRKVFTDEIYSTAIGEPRYPAEVVNAIGDALQEVMFKNANPTEAAKKANDRINEFLKSYNGSL